MKNALASLCLIVICSTTFAAKGAPLTGEELVQATQEALKVFRVSSPDHAAHLTGFKTWQSGVDAKVKIYIAHDGMTMDDNYLCQKHGGQLHCSQMK